MRPLVLSYVGKLRIEGTTNMGMRMRGVVVFPTLATLGDAWYTCLCVLDELMTKKTRIVKRSSKILNCLEILRANVLRMRVVPPNVQPKYLSAETVHATVPEQSKALPLVVSAHCPEVVHASGIGGTSRTPNGRIRAPSCSQIWFGEL